MIDVDGLVQVFGRTTVLHGVTFKVPAGAVYGFIGPNGAGKTTTIRVMATLLAPTAGTVKVGGYDVVAEPESVRKVIGYMPDMSGVYERITAAEYLEFFAAANDIPLDKRARTVANVIELADIGHLRDREVAAMSKGQKQRLLLARTLLHDPKVLILDEPASDLDPRARIELRMLLTELGRMGKTIFLSSHILTELADVCTWVGIIERGRIAASGPIAEVQAAMRPGRRVRVRVLARAAEAEAALRAVEGVREVARLEPAGNEAAPGGGSEQAVGAGEAGSAPAGFEVTYEGGEARVAEMVFALASARAPVAAVEPERHDLERIFMDLTRAPGQGM